MKDRAVKKVQIAIDKMIDLQQDLVDDPGDIQRLLDSLNALTIRIESGQIKNGRIKLG